MRPIIRITFTLFTLAVTTAGFAQIQNVDHNFQQSPLGFMGVISGNELDLASGGGCYIGTIGTMLTAGDKDYLLSNNHVFARSNAASIGEDILHVAPCSSGSIHIGELAAFVPIKTKRRQSNKVDAALARITPNVISANPVLHVGTSFNDAFQVSNTIEDAYNGLEVMKSGRTTGQTYGVVASLGVNVYVSYDSGRALFVDQISISDGSFSAGGDSGSLIVTKSSTGNVHNPVALLFAGSSTRTIGSPIGFVLEELGSLIGEPLTFGSSGVDSGVTDLSGGGDGGGGNGGNGNPGRGGGRNRSDHFLPSVAINKAIGVRNQFEVQIMEVPGVQGTGIGLSRGQAPVIEVYTNGNSKSVRSRLPQSFDGVDVVIVETGEFIAY